MRHWLVLPTDPRGWIGVGCYLLVVALLGMMWADKGLLNNDFFKVIATALILNGWNQGPVGWAYQATKGGGEMADSNARIAEAAAGVPERHPAAPQKVTVVNPPNEPIPVDQAP